MRDKETGNTGTDRLIHWDETNCSRAIGLNRRDETL